MWGGVPERKPALTGWKVAGRHFQWAISHCAIAFRPFDPCTSLWWHAAMADHPTRDAVIVFAKLPVPGQVKTRLAASVGNEPAALFYRHCAERAIGALGRCGQPGGGTVSLPLLCWTAGCHSLCCCFSVLAICFWMGMQAVLCRRVPVLFRGGG